MRFHSRGHSSALVRRRGLLERRMRRCRLWLRWRSEEVMYHLVERFLRAFIAIETSSEFGIAKLIWEAALQTLARTGVLGQPVIATDDVLQQAVRWLLLVVLPADHALEHGANGVAALIRCAYILEAIVIDKNLLNDEGCDSFAELAAELHRAEAEWDDFGA